MNIGILGLLPDQVRQVSLSYPDHSLRFLSKDRQSETGNFAKGCDKVVLMTKFIGHDMQDRVPMSKRIFVSGGIEGLRRELNKLPTTVRDVAAPKAPTVATPKPNGKGRWKGSEVIDWSAYMAANVGDEVTIARPATVPLASFKHRLDVGRSVRKHVHGIVSTPPKFIDGAAVLTIKAINAPTKTKRKRKADTVAMPATDAPDTAMPEATQETPQMQIAVEVQRPVTVAPLLTQARESAFWQSVFVETMKQWPGAPIDTIAARADEALRAYNARASVSVAVQQH